MKQLLENWNKFINEEDSMMKMSLYDFDQTEKGWRSFKNPSDQVKVLKTGWKEIRFIQNVGICFIHYTRRKL